MITVGTKVAIMPGADYANRFIGQVGIVRKNYKEKIGVQNCEAQVVPENIEVRVEDMFTKKGENNNA